MAETLKEFLVSYGFRVDEPSRAQTERATKAAEDRITASNAAAVKQRLEADKSAQAQRIRTALAAGEQLTADDRRFVLEQEKNRVDAAERDRKREDTAAKQRRERLENAAKQVHAFALNATAVAAGVVAAVGTATGGVLAATDQAAKGFERLNYMAQNSGTTVRGIQAFAYAIAQLGGDAKAAEGELAAFGSQLKTFPQFEKNLQSMGIATRDASGHMKDAAEIAKDYFAVLAKMPRAQQDALGEVYGFSPNTIRAGTRPGLGGFMTDERAHQARIGADADEAGQRAAAFERAMRTLQDDIQAVKTRIETALFGLFKPALDNVSHWIEEHGKAISTTVIQIAKGISDVVSAFVNTGIVKDSMKALSDGLEQFAKYVSSGDFRKDIKGFCADIMSLAKWVRSALEYLGILPTKVGAASVPEPTGSFSDHEFGGGGASLRNRRHHDAHDYTDNDAVQRKLSGFRGGGPGALNTRQQKENAAAIADELRKAGAPDEGTAAVLGSMQTESTFNPRAHNDVTGGHTGLWQWDARRWPKVKAWIEKQGGDPWDARWQTRAYVAEGRAKPGDDIYDNGETSGGFNDVMNSRGDLGKAVHGVQRSERFGRGEEGGRAAHASKWLGNLPGSPAPASTPAPSSSTPTAPSDAEYKAAKARSDALQVPGHRMTQEGHDQLPKDDAVIAAHWAAVRAAGVPPMPHVEEEYFGAKAGPEVKDGRKIGPSASAADIAHKHLMNELIVRAAHHGMLHPYLHGKALGDTESLRRSIHNEIKRESHASITHNPSYVINTTDVKAGMEAARMSADRGNRDLIRNIQPKLA